VTVNPGNNCLPLPKVTEYTVKDIIIIRDENENFVTARSRSHGPLHGTAAMPEDARRGGDGEGDEPSGAGSSSRGRDLDSDRKKSKKRY
jgi:hypothetical protein